MASRVFNLLLVDDDPLVHQSLKLTLPSHWKAFSAQSEKLIPYERFYHAALIDMHLQADSAPAGPRIIETLLKRQAQTEVVAISGDLSLDLMESCLKAGAQKFLAKPLASEELLLVLDKIEALWALRSIESSADRRALRWVGEGAGSQKILKRIAELRGEDGCVLIEGETGTGKEVVAHLLHEQENERPFVTVNIAGIPDNLFESELFGHVKGAFTGAEQNKIGLIEAANGGDIFFDEIEALPLHQQVKLLRFLESGEIRRVGAKENMQIRTRVIAASNRPLQKMVEDGEFREDLYYRLSAQKIQLPPLRERREDVPALARYFLENEKPRRHKSFAPEALLALQERSWPGNIRELKRVCEQLSLSSPLPVIRAEDLRVWGATLPVAAEIEGPLDLSKGLTDLMAEHEARLLRAALEQSADVEQASQLLKVSRSNLYKKLKDHQIEYKEKN